MRWFTLKNIDQAINFLFRCVSIVALIAAMNLFVVLKRPRATIGLVNVSIRNDCALLRNFYEKVEKDIPPGLLDYCRGLEQEQIATPPDWLSPIPLLLLEYPPLEQPAWIWDWGMEDEFDFEKSLEAHQALSYSQYGIFSVQVKNEGDLDIKDAVVYSVVDEMYYVDDDGQVTEKKESDMFNLQQGKTKFVEFQMHFGQKLDMVEGDLRRHFDIVYEKRKVEEINRAVVIGLLVFAFILTAGLSILGAVELKRSDKKNSKL